MDRGLKVSDERERAEMWAEFQEGRDQGLDLAIDQLERRVAEVSASTRGRWERIELVRVLSGEIEKLRKLKGGAAR